MQDDHDGVIMKHEDRILQTLIDPADDLSFEQDGAATLPTQTFDHVLPSGGHDSRAKQYMRVGEHSGDPPGEGLLRNEDAIAATNELV